MFENEYKYLFDCTPGLFVRVSTQKHESTAKQGKWSKQWKNNEWILEFDSNVFPVSFGSLTFSNEFKS